MEPTYLSAEIDTHRLLGQVIELRILPQSFAIFSAIDPLRCLQLRHLGSGPASQVLECKSGWNQIENKEALPSPLSTGLAAIGDTFCRNIISQ
jgi:hypothetical protein